jgi:hypothetical protein
MPLACPVPEKGRVYLAPRCPNTWLQLRNAVISVAARGRDPDEAHGHGRDHRRRGCWAQTRRLRRDVELVGAVISVAAGTSAVR